MHRTLERLDSLAATIVPLAYLAGLVGGTMAYFTGIKVAFGLAVGIALAVASELHSFLQQRRTRAAWGVLNRTAPDDPRYAGLRRQVWAGALMLAALLLFQTFTSVAFVSETWTPARGYLPGWLQVGIRGAVVPFLLLLAGFLAPLTVDAGAVLSRASGEMLHKAIRATTKQWAKRIDRARRQGLDLAPIAVALMLDAGDTDGARRVEMIARGLNVAEGLEHASTHASGQSDNAEATMALETHPAIAAPASARTDADPTLDHPPLPEPEMPPERPPTGPGSPAVQTRKVQTRRKARKPAVIRLQPVPAEERIRAALAEHPGASVKQLAEAAGVSSATASKWRKVVHAEQDRQGAAHQQQQQQSQQLAQ